jgi:hypothetical protein
MQPIAAALLNQSIIYYFVQLVVTGHKSSFLEISASKMVSDVYVNTRPIMALTA